MKSMKKREACPWWVLTIIVTFGIGYIHHKWFYPLQFNGDSAAMQVLAKAIFSEGSLLPKDFSYGNQIVFLRSSPFIALAFFLGFKSYGAFIIGSSLSIAFWGGILFFFLNMLFKSGKKAFLFSVCLLIPFGWWDSDFVLGQQSHLTNVILSLGIAISVFNFIKERNYFFILIACACVFVMSAEAPMRGLLIIAPLLIAIILSSLNFKNFIFLAISIFFSFILAYFLNKWLIAIRPVALNYFDLLVFQSSNEMLANFSKTTAETISGVSSINEFSGKRLSLLGVIFFSFNIVIILCYFSFVFSGIFKINKIIKERLNANFGEKLSFPKHSFDFLHLTATAGLIVGALAVIALNPDSSRHYLWAVFLGKLVILTWLYDNFSRFTAPKYSALLLFLFSLLASMWFANLVKLNWNVDREIKHRNYSSATHDIEKAVKNTGIRNIYGEDFWRMMPLNSFIDGLNAQALVYDGKEIYPYSFLTRRSWSCVDKDVLYFLKNGQTDKVIEDRLIKAQGRKIASGADYTVWVGPRVWNIPPNGGCSE